MKKGVPIPSQADEWRKLNREQREEDFLARLRAGARPTEIARAIRKPPRFYQHWLTDPTYRARYEEARAIGRKNREMATNAGNVYDPDEWLDHKPPPFRQFQREFIGRPTPKHMDLLVDAWEDKTNRIVIYLGPPGCGKDTTGGDIALHETLDRTKRVAWVMKSGTFSRRRLGRLEGYYWDHRAYVKPQGPDTSEPGRRVFEEFGPFKWDSKMTYPDGSKVGQPKWTQNELYFLGRDGEADPNLWATGVEGSMYGARIDTGILSDIFDEENQKHPDQRESQISWIIGTFLSRLDDKGRALFLGTRIAEWDNWGRLIEEMVGSAPILYQDDFTTKYANGVCVIQVRAIQHDEDGREHSYWPERFSLRNYLTKNKNVSVLQDDTKVFLDEIPEDEQLAYGKRGYELVLGLRGIRGDSAASLRWFSTAYQQQPPSSEEGEFPLALLDSCDDFGKSYGMWTPGSTLVLGIDPARTGGAAWVLWEWDGETISVVDYYFGTNIGVTGLRERLLVDPIVRYRPRYAIYESNRETSVLEHPEVIAAVRGSKTELRGVPTHSMNRGVGELRVAAMAFDMGNGLIKWPAHTPRTAADPTASRSTS